MHDSPSIVDQWHVCILSDRRSCAYPSHYTTAFASCHLLFPPSVPVTLRSRHRRCRCRRMTGFPCSSSRLLHGVGSPSLVRVSSFVRRGAQAHPPTDTVPFWFMRSPFRVSPVFACCKLRTFRRFTICSTFSAHPGGFRRLNPTVSASSRELHTPELLRTHVPIGSRGDESSGYFTVLLFTNLLDASCHTLEFCSLACARARA